MICILITCAWAMRLMQFIFTMYICMYADSLGEVIRIIPHTCPESAFGLGVSTRETPCDAVAFRVSSFLLTGLASTGGLRGAFGVPLFVVPWMVGDSTLIPSFWESSSRSLSTEERREARLYTEKSLLA